MGANPRYVTRRQSFVSASDKRLSITIEYGRATAHAKRHNKTATQIFHISFKKHDVT